MKKDRKAKRNKLRKNKKQYKTEEVVQEEKNIIEELKQEKETFKEKMQFPNNRRTKDENIMARKNADFEDEMRKSAYIKAIERMKNQEER